MAFSSRDLWPKTLWLVRHGESAGNVARNVAEAAGLPLIDIAVRDVDVPLSPLGERQARALGRWYSAKPEQEKPTVVLSSPYIRAKATAALVIEEAQLDRRKAFVHVVDERLREKEFGILNKLTKAGIEAKFPDEAALRAQIGKFYYRPPGGESWCDVVLRLRSVLDHVQLRYSDERVLVVAHQVTVLCFRYLIEAMDEARILGIDREKDVANCGVTHYEAEDDAHGRRSLVLSAYNYVAPLEEANEPVTTEPDPPALPR